MKAKTFRYNLKNLRQISGLECISRRCKPCSVPRVWSAMGPEESAGWDFPVIRFQLKLVDVWGCRPQREPWKVHSLSAGQRPVALLYTLTSSMAIVPCLPPVTASIINWTEMSDRNSFCRSDQQDNVNKRRLGIKITCIGLEVLKVRSANLHLFPWVLLLIHTTVSASPEGFVINFNEPDNRTI